MEAIVYVLRSEKSGRFYIGSTSDLERRAQQHRRGHTHTTKRLGDFKIVFIQEVASLDQARWAERKIKSWKRRDFIEKIIRDGKISFLKCSDES